MKESNSFFVGKSGIIFFFVDIFLEIFGYFSSLSLSIFQEASKFFIDFFCLMWFFFNNIFNNDKSPGLIRVFFNSSENILFFFIGGMWVRFLNQRDKISEINRFISFNKIIFFQIFFEFSRNLFINLNQFLLTRLLQNKIQNLQKQLILFLFLFSLQLIMLKNQFTQTKYLIHIKLNFNRIHTIMQFLL
jgi:hypothetical protein